MRGIEQYLDAREVSSLLTISLAAAQRLMKQCEHVRQGRMIRVSGKALRAFLAQKTTPIVQARASRRRSPPSSTWLRPIGPRTNTRRARSDKPETKTPSAHDEREPGRKAPTSATPRFDPSAPPFKVEFELTPSKPVAKILDMVERWRMARDLRELAHEIRAILTSAELVMSKGGYCDRLVTELLEAADRVDPIALIRDDAAKFGLGKFTKKTSAHPS